MFSMQKIALEVQKTIVSLRLVGRSIPEISREIGVAKTTVQRYVVNIKVPQEYQELLRQKQGGAKMRASALRSKTYCYAQELLKEPSERDRLMLLVGLYWGEGTKKDFGIINSDPALIQSFTCSLSCIGVAKERLSISLRVHSDISILKAERKGNSPMVCAAFA